MSKWKIAQRADNQGINIIKAESETSLALVVYQQGDGVKQLMQPIQYQTKGK